MHSTILRGTDFQMVWRETAVSHPTFFAPLTTHQRLGVIAPRRFDGAGAITLIMAYVTAFYDRHRALSNNFFVYPNYFTFQQAAPVASYAEFDIWPPHRDVLVDETIDALAAALTDRAINVLLLPDGDIRDRPIPPLYRHDLEQQLQRCFVYSLTGSLAAPDLTITCPIEPFKSYAVAMFESLDSDETVNQAQAAWLDGVARDHLRQSFREISPAEALRRL